MLYVNVDSEKAKRKVLNRYPADKSDRIWIPTMLNDWANISTHQEVISNYTNSFPELPSTVLQTAAIPSTSAPKTSNLEVIWTQEEGVNAPCFINLHFAEIQQLPADGKREFDIYYNGKLL